MKMIDQKKLPQHIAIIMDGNGRWAAQRHLPRTQGHLEGVNRVEEVVETARRLGVKILTLFTFSTENWKRPRQEVVVLLKTLISVLQQKINKLNENDIKLQFIGREEGVPLDVLESLAWATTLTKDNSGMILNIAFNYGGRQEILDAIKTIARKVLNGEIRVEEISDETINQALYTRGLPDPDLLIRTSGEMRISNFLLWQLSYSELYFTEKYWPDFTEDEFLKAIEAFQNRERRYGTISAYY